MWNCPTCGDLHPTQVTLEEKCGSCQDDINFNLTKEEPYILRRSKSLKKYWDQFKGVGE